MARSPRRPYDGPDREPDNDPDDAPRGRRRPPGMQAALPPGVQGEMPPWAGPQPGQRRIRGGHFPGAPGGGMQSMPIPSLGGGYGGVPPELLAAAANSLGAGPRRAPAGGRLSQEAIDRGLTNDTGNPIVDRMPLPPPGYVSPQYAGAYGPSEGRGLSLGGGRTSAPRGGREGMPGGFPPRPSFTPPAPSGPRSNMDIIRGGGNRPPRPSAPPPGGVGMTPPAPIPHYGPAPTPPPAGGGTSFNPGGAGTVTDTYNLPPSTNAPGQGEPGMPGANPFPQGGGTVIPGMPPGGTISWNPRIGPPIPQPDGGPQIQGGPTPTPQVAPAYPLPLPLRRPPGQQMPPVQTNGLGLAQPVEANSFEQYLRSKGQ